MSSKVGSKDYSKFQLSTSPSSSCGDWLAAQWCLISEWSENGSEVIGLLVGGFDSVRLKSSSPDSRYGLGSLFYCEDAQKWAEKGVVTAAGSPKWMNYQRSGSPSSHLDCYHHHCCPFQILISPVSPSQTFSVRNILRRKERSSQSVNGTHSNKHY
ncbi:unnamed protein product [Acanthocheilonema viteae]|uniref:Uncharacterized protein n=1 Tax=Acanthocheilonema viteae TaxID=6277 RepID=A0A498SUI4_ACAVI|nr:unnamed protein product [Acanthocheilonema viteae]